MFEAILWIVGIFFLLSFIFGGSSGTNDSNLNNGGCGFDDDYYCDNDFSCFDED